MTRDGLVIVGAGGHAKVVIDILQQAGLRPFGCTSINNGQSHVLGVPIIGTDADLPKFFASGSATAFVAIGDNATRRSVTQYVRSIGFRLINAISPRATIAKSVTMGEGIAIMAGAVVNAGSEIGTGAVINTAASVDHDCRIGNFAHVAPGTHLAGCVRLGDGVFMGVGSCVIPGISVGAWTTVGAGAVVIRDLPEDAVAMGVPAAIARFNHRGIAHE